MIFRKTALPGAFVLEPQRHLDERGFFARTWCSEEFAKHGLEAQLSQCSISYNARRGTLRGMHWQAAPCPEAKVVRCTSGAVFDVIVDLRRESPCYLRWTSVELTSENRLEVYVPPFVAHGFLTLSSEAQVEYAMNVPYVPEAARGFRWDDPSVGIDWPSQPSLLSDRDRSYPLLSAAE